jgi:uncharacterized membrane protein
MIKKNCLNIPLVLLIISITGLVIKYLSGYKSNWLSLILLSLIIFYSAQYTGLSAAKKIKLDPLILKRVFSIWTIFLPLIFFIQQYLKYRAYNSELWDIGIISHAFSTTMRGYFFQNIAAGSIIQVSAFAQHTELILILLYPFFAIIPHPLTLVAIQSIVLSVTVIFFYRLCRKILGDETSSVILSFCFSIYPAFLYTGILDFHGDALAMPFIILMITATVEKKSQSTIIFLILSLLCKEYAAFTGFMWGIYCMFSMKEKKSGTIICIISSVWFTIAMFSQSFIRPAGISSLFNIVYNIPEGSDACNVFQRLLSLFAQIPSSGNIQNLVFLFIPMLFYCFKYPWIIFFLLLPLLKDAPYGLSIESHRLALYIPFIWYCVIKVFQNNDSNARLTANSNLSGKSMLLNLHKSNKAALLSLLTAAIISSVLFSEAPWSQRFIRNWTSKYEFSQRARLLSKISNEIPAEIPVSASPAVFPHIINRHYLYLFPTIGKAEYAVIDKKRCGVSELRTIDSLVECGWSKNDENEFGLLLQKPSCLARIMK